MYYYHNSPLPNLFLSFDPGHKSGGVAWTTSDPEDSIETTTMGELRDEFGTIGAFLDSFENPLGGVAVEEIPMIDTPGSAKLFINYGAILEAILQYEGFDFLHISPQEWKRFYRFPMGMTYAEHKKFATVKRKEMFPEVKSPVPCDDAVLILGVLLSTYGDGDE